MWGNRVTEDGVGARIKDDQKTALLQPELIFLEQRVHLQCPSMVDLIRIPNEGLTIFAISSKCQLFTRFNIVVPNQAMP